MISQRRVKQLEEATLDFWESKRPQSLREFDQIPMQRADLLESVRTVAPLLAGKRVAFMGDHDGVSVLLGMLSSQGLLPAPEHMQLLDFDERLLVQALEIAQQHEFVDSFGLTLYNAFDPVPTDLIGVFDAFYTNPPYGMSNAGASVRLFVTRGMELAAQADAKGYVVLPYDHERYWTQTAMQETQQFLTDHGWNVVELATDLHAYHLDDDPELKSALLTVQAAEHRSRSLPWGNRAVDHQEIVHFYGKSVQPPYPKYILQSGQRVWRSDRAAS